MKCPVDTPPSFAPQVMVPTGSDMFHRPDGTGRKGRNDDIGVRTLSSTRLGTQRGTFIVSFLESGLGPRILVAVWVILIESPPWQRQSAAKLLCSSLILTPDHISTCWRIPRVSVCWWVPWPKTCECATGISKPESWAMKRWKRCATSETHQTKVVGKSRNVPTRSHLRIQI